MGLRRRLADTLLALGAAIFGPAGDDHPELRRRHVEPLRDVLADPHRPAVAAAAGEALRLDDDLDPFQMRRERLARSRGAAPLACRFRRLELGLDRAEPGLHLLEGEGLLVGIELLGAAAEAGTLQLPDDGMKIGDPFLGALVYRLEPGVVGFEPGLFGLEPSDLGSELRRIGPELSRLGL
jgi:hypothetical protein